jgi:N-methylhydantoinase A
MPDQPIEVVTLRLTVLALRASPPDEAAPADVGTLEAARSAQRSVWFPETGFVRTPVYRRTALPIGATFAGPAIVEQMDATTVVPPAWTVRVDARANLLLERAKTSVTKVAQWDLQQTR